MDGRRPGRQGTTRPVNPPRAAPPGDPAKLSAVCCCSFNARDIHGMHRRETIAMLAGAAPSAFGMLSAFRATRAHAQTQKPNILFILVDYGELGVYGRGVTRGAPTPRIDKLTSKGLRLTNNPAFAGKTGNGDWADMLAEMDYNVGLILDAVDRLRIRDNTIVIFVSDNGPEFVRPWDGWAGPWRGQYFTAWEGGIRVPFMIRWPGKIPAGRVSDEIVHGVDMSRRLPASPALACRMTVPSTASINRTFSRARPKSQPARAFSFGAPGCRRRSGAISKCTFSNRKRWSRRRSSSGSPYYSISTKSSRGRGKDLHAELGCRSHPQDGRRIRGKREKASSNRDGHARPLHTPRVAARLAQVHPATRATTRRCPERNTQLDRITL